MKHTQKLEDFAFTFDNYRELDVSGYDFEVDALQSFHDEHSNYFTDLDDDLYEAVEELRDVAGEHFDTVAAQEQLEQEVDERRHEGSRHLS